MFDTLCETNLWFPRNQQYQIKILKHKNCFINSPLLILQTIKFSSIFFSSSRFPFLCYNKRMSERDVMKTCIVTLIIMYYFIRLSVTYLSPIMLWVELHPPIKKKKKSCFGSPHSHYLVMWSYLEIESLQIPLRKGHAGVEWGPNPL